MSGPRPPSEDARLEALRSYGILDTPPEQVYDDLLSLAANVCKVPLAAITFVDESRVWLKSTLGLTSSETSRDAAFCSNAILDPGVFVVPDAHADAAYASNPMVVGEPHVRFYAGAPLVAPGGQAVGVLCVLDRVPRLLGQEQAGALRMLARLVVELLERRRSLGLQRWETETLRAAAGRVPEVIRGLASLQGDLAWVGQHLSNRAMGAAILERLQAMSAALDDAMARLGDAAPREGR